jgi:alpha-tubulin suppressor-like RCC1 family protein
MKMMNWHKIVATLSVICITVTLIVVVNAQFVTVAEIHKPYDAATQMAIGSSHVCVLTSAGKVMCWGSSGKLGDGSNVNRAEPSVVSGMESGVKAIVAGDNHTCALKTDGKVWCWGYNNYGQLGDGSIDIRFIPSEVRRLGEAVTALAAGAAHTCAILQSGTAKCWGKNINGELGIGNRTNQRYPVDVQMTSGEFNTISAGNEHTCALTTAQTVKCWGKIEGVNEAFTGIKTAPIEILDVDEPVYQLAVGRDHTCVLVRDGRVRCWGDNSWGQLGNGGQSVINVIQVANLIGAQALFSGHGQSCVILLIGKMQCWGMNVQGQLGNGNKNGYNIPVDVLGLTEQYVQIGISRNVVSVPVPNNENEWTSGSACALSVGGGIKCWGNNTNGQLGTGNFAHSLVPVQVIGFEGANLNLTPPPGPPVSTPTPTPAVPSKIYAALLFNLLNIPEPEDPNKGFFVGPNEAEPNDENSQANGPLISGLDYYGLATDLKDVFYVTLTRPGEMVATIANHTCPDFRVYIISDVGGIISDDRASRGTVRLNSTTGGKHYITVQNGDACSQRAPYQLRVTYR